MGNNSSSKDDSVIHQYEIDTHNLNIGFQLKVNTAETIITRKEISPSKKSEDANKRMMYFCSNVQDNIKRHYLLRHPFIVQILQFSPLKDSIIVTTEKCRPLLFVWKVLYLDECLLGFQQILQALQFLHDHAKISHGCIREESMFVSLDSTWKLGSFYYCTAFSSLQPSDWETLHALTAGPDEVDNDSAFLYHEDSLGCYDMYCFARMVTRWIDGLMTEEQKETASAGRKGISESMTSLLQSFSVVLKNSCLNAAPRDRLTAQQLLLHDVFSHPFVRIHNFLSHFTSKSAEEKTHFFRDLPQLLSKIPEEVVARRLAHLLLSRVVLIDVLAQSTIAKLLQPRRKDNESGVSGHQKYFVCQYTSQETGLISEELFRECIIPLLNNIFAVEERNVRITLLIHFPSYAYLFKRKTLLHTILPRIRLGLFDCHIPLVSLTFHALAQCVLLLGSEPIIGQPPRGILFPEAGPKQSSIFVSPEATIPTTKQSSSANQSVKPLLKDLAKLSPHYNPSTSIQSQETKVLPSENGSVSHEIQRHARKSETSSNARKLKGRRVHFSDEKHVSEQQTNTFSKEKEVVDETKLEDSNETVAPMNEETRNKVEVNNIEPADSSWSEWDEPPSSNPKTNEKNTPTDDVTLELQMRDEQINSIFAEMTPVLEVKASELTPTNDHSNENQSILCEEDKVTITNCGHLLAAEIGDAWTEDWDTIDAGECDDMSGVEPKIVPNDPT